MAGERPHLVVTGAAGLIGRTLVEGALAEGWRVTALVVRDRAPLPDGWDAVEVERWEVGEALPASCAGADALCHLAAHVPGDGGSPANAGECFRVNALGTLALLEECTRLEVRRLVYASAGNAYAPKDGPVAEQDPLYPSRRAAIYLTSKLAGEIFCEHYGSERGLPVTILRIAAVYGPGMQEGSVVSRFVAAAAAGAPLRIADGGRYAVDLVLAEDVGRAIRAAVSRGADGTFNVGSGRRTSLLELAEAVMGVAGASRSLLHVEPTRPDGSGTGYPVLDIMKAAEALDFRPTPLEAGLALMLESAAASAQTRTSIDE
jgi:UDP-glucose 4-epimerase